MPGPPPPPPPPIGLMGGGAPPPPPPFGGLPPPSGGGNRSALLNDIASGNKPRLKKVDPTLIKDRSQVQVAAGSNSSADSAPSKSTFGLLTRPQYLQ